MRIMTDESRKQLLNFCENIIFLRKELGYTKKEMAKKLSISVKSLSEIERLRVPPRLSCEILFIIKIKFGIDPNDILKKRLSES